ncbi:MAG: alpha/beta hydrolase [Pseudomonadota bacterium]
MRLRAAFWAGDGTTVVVGQGRTEFLEKYGQVAGDLRDRGFAVAMVDWRGQGLSDRALADRRIGHVGAYAEYQRDLDALLAGVAAAGLPPATLLLAHSMGGAIGLRALGRGLFDRAVFSAPLWDLPRPPLVSWLLEPLLAAAPRLRLGHRLLPGHGLEPVALRDAYDGNDLTSDPDQYARFQTLLRAHPDLQLGGASLGWVAATLAEIRALAAAPAPDTPILTFLGGEERVVAPGAIRRHSARQTGARLVELDGARHETLMETPQIRTRIWREIDAFCSA